MCIKFLEEDFLWVWERQKWRRITPKHRDLKHNKSLPREIRNVMNALQLITEHDYEAARGPANTPNHPVAQALKRQLLHDMEIAFETYVGWHHASTYRALASILTRMKILNTRRSRWQPDAVERLLKRDSSEHVSWTKPRYVLEAQVVERPDITIWNMKVK